MKQGFPCCDGVPKPGGTQIFMIFALRSVHGGVYS